MILPSSLADAVRGRGFGGDIHVNFTNHGGITDRDIMRHSETIAKAVRREIRNGNPHLSF